MPERSDKSSSVKWRCWRSSRRRWPKASRDSVGGVEVLATHQGLGAVHRSTIHLKLYHLKTCYAEVYVLSVGFWPSCRPGRLWRRLRPTVTNRFHSRWGRCITLVMRRFQRLLCRSRWIFCLGTLLFLRPPSAASFSNLICRPAPLQRRPRPSRLPFPDAVKLPAVRWKLHNIAQMDARKRQAAVNALQGAFDHG